VLQQGLQRLRFLDADEVREAGFVSAISLSGFLVFDFGGGALLVRELRAGIVCAETNLCEAVSLAH
jgi:hypothetical protein